MIRRQPERGLTTPEGRPEPQLVVLLARGLQLYRQASRQALRRDGFGDLPRSGSWLLLALASGPAAVGQLADRLATSKQAMSRLIDTLVERGYASRTGDPADGRRVRLSLTERGRAAAESVAGAVREVDREVELQAGVGATDRAGDSLREIFEARPGSSCRPPDSTEVEPVPAQSSGGGASGISPAA
jgi:DNA-binding MarR family transcriptional regulator